MEHPILCWVREPISLSFGLSEWDGKFDFSKSGNALKKEEQFLLSKLGMYVFSKPDKDDERKFWRTGEINLTWVGESKEVIMRNERIDQFELTRGISMTCPQGGPSARYGNASTKEWLLSIASRRPEGIQEFIPRLVESQESLTGELIVDENLLEFPDDLNITLSMLGMKGSLAAERK